MGCRIFAVAKGKGGKLETALGSNCFSCLGVTLCIVLNILSIKELVFLHWWLLIVMLVGLGCVTFPRSSASRKKKEF